MLVNVSLKCRRLPLQLTRGYATLESKWKCAIQERNQDVNALVSVSSWEDGTQNTRGPLQDVPVAVKDNICTSSLPTTCSSAILRDFTSPFNATVVDLLVKAGAPIVGKANCDEFGMGSLNVYSVHGSVVNPYQPPASAVSQSKMERRSAGGSSGGSAAAVASGMCYAALGTDTGGSVRLPASYCGVVGLKPSYGVLSRWGVVSYADSLDCVGVFGANVSYVKRVFDVLSKYDERDPSAATQETRLRALAECHRYTQTWDPSGKLDGLRIGIPQEYFPAELDHSILRPFKAILNGLKERGASIVPVFLPSTPYALSAYYVIASAEASSNLARYDGIQYGLRVDPPPGADRTKTANVYSHTRSKGFGSEVKKRMLLGTYALSADAFDNYFLQAQRVRNLVRSDFDRVFRSSNVLFANPKSSGASDGVDILLHPSAIGTAPPLNDSTTHKAKGTEGLDSYVQDVLTVPASLAGLPAMSVPAGLGEDGWPVGVSVVSQWGCDEMVLQVGRAIERLS